MLDPRLVEIAARAIDKAGVLWIAGKRAEGGDPSWVDVPEEVFAEAALTAINASGEWWVAPENLNERMYDAAEPYVRHQDVDEMWDAMRAAYLAEPEAVA